MAKEKKEQQYHKGDKVRVVNIGSPFWESENGEMKIYDRCPEAIGQVGEIIGSYNDLFPTSYKEGQGADCYEIKWPEGTKLHVAWWYEYQLESANINTPREQQKQYPDHNESNMVKELKKLHDDALDSIMWSK